MDTQKLRELLQRATKGPLVNESGNGNGFVRINKDGYGWRCSVNDAALIADGINALPTLLAEIDRLQGALRDALGPADEAMRMAGMREVTVHEMWTAMAAVRLRGILDNRPPSGPQE